MFSQHTYLSSLASTHTQCFHILAVAVVEFDPTTYTVTESEGVVMFRIVKRTTSTQPVSVFFSTSPGTATGRDPAVDTD